MELAAKARKPSHDTTWMDRTKFRNWTKFLSAQYQVKKEDKGARQVVRSHVHLPTATVEMEEYGW
jgi:hypothetical protein